MMEQFDNMGVPEHFPICGIFVGFLCYYTLAFLCATSCGGGFYIASLAYDSGMGPR